MWISGSGYTWNNWNQSIKYLIEKEEKTRVCETLEMKTENLNACTNLQ